MAADDEQQEQQQKPRKSVSFVPEATILDAPRGKKNTEEVQGDRNTAERHTGMLSQLMPVSVPTTTAAFVALADPCVASHRNDRAL
ncbi:hypothetical protein KEM52_002768 [Ascosphaera acerosa]|nr:hypothetical protein KEM52_002768 [Ascosphaera acerosa]